MTTQPIDRPRQSGRRPLIRNQSPPRGILSSAARARDLGKSPRAPLPGGCAVTHTDPSALAPRDHKISKRRGSKGRAGRVTGPREKRAAYCKRYYSANRERLIEKHKLWVAANRERVRRNHKRWYEANREKQREKNKRWHEANRERARQQGKRWRDANREKVRANLRKWRAANWDRVHAANRERTKRWNSKARFALALCQNWGVEFVYRDGEWYVKGIDD